MNPAAAAAAVDDGLDRKYDADETDAETQNLIEMLAEEDAKDLAIQQQQQPRVRNRTAAAAAFAVQPPSVATAIPKVWTTECEALYAWCRHLNTLCVLLYTASAIVSLCLCVLYHITTHRTIHLEQFTGSATLVYAPSWTVAPVWLVPPVFFASALSHLLLHFMRTKTWKDRWLVEQRNPLRWLDHLVSVPLLMLSLAVFCGLNTYAELLLLYVCQWVASVSGHWLMRAVNPLRPPQPRIWQPLVLSSVLHVCCWAALGMPVMSAPSATPAAVLGVYWSAVLVATVAVPGAAAYAYRGARSLPQYLKSECVTMTLHLLFKTLVGWQIVGHSVSS